MAFSKCKVFVLPKANNIINNTCEIQNAILMANYHDGK
jgi:hypothetical protein